jgi:hypothetical protein
MKKITILSVFVLMLFSGFTAQAQQTLMGYWNFNQGVSGTPWSTPINADAGEGSAVIQAGTWVWENLDYSEAFAGSTQNALFGDPAGASLSLRSNAMNGNYIQIALDMTGYEDLEISYWSRRTATGFNANQWSWSIDGQNFNDFGPVINPSDASSGAVIVLDPIAEVNNSPTVYLRYTLNGATTGTGNNRIDNLQLNATQISDPNMVATPSFSPTGGLFFAPLDVEITTATDDADIYYTLDGSEPTQESNLYTSPINIATTTTLRARAFKDGLEPSNVATALYEFPVEVANIETLRQQPQDGTIYLLTGEAILTFQQSFRNQKYIQDATAAIRIDDDAANIVTTYNLYDGITGIAGTIIEFGNMLQFVPVADPGPATSIDNTLAPAVISMNLFVNNFEDYEAQLVTIQNVNFSATGDFATGQVYTITDGTTDGSFRTTFFNADYIGEPIPQETLHLTGILNARSEGDYITARFSDDFSFELVGTDASLSLFTLGNMNVLGLGGIVVTDPDTDAGALLHVEDITDFEGIVVQTTDANATYTVTLNGDPVDAADLPTQPLAYDDVVVVTVVAEDGETTMFYKVTIVGEDRTLSIILPVEGETYYAGETYPITWESENIEALQLDIYVVGLPEPIFTFAPIPAAAGTIDFPIDNGVEATLNLRLSDASDLNFFAESGPFFVVDEMPPTIVELAPQPGATDVDVDVILMLGADENLAVGSGYITIHRADDDSEFAQIDVTSALVTIDGPDAFISLPQNLDFETEYYVLIDAGAFEDLFENAFEGIDDPTTWSFTTAADVPFEIICNGDFELWTDGLPDCWYGQRSNIPASNVVQYSANPQSGSYAVTLINATSSHQRFTSQHTQVENGASYVITFWLKGQGDIRTGLYDGRETGFGYAPYNSYIVVNSTEWSQHSQTVTAANTHDEAEFVFSVRNTVEANGHLQIDNVSIEMISAEPQEVANLAALRASATGGNYSVLSEVVITFMQDYRNQVYVQDESAAILIDDPDGIFTTQYAVGDGITGLTGTLTTFNNMLQLVPMEDPGAPSSTDNDIVPEVRTLASLTSDDQAKLLKIHNVSFVTTGTFATGSSYDLTSPNGTGVFRTAFFDADYIGTTIPTQAQNLTVLVNQHMASIQVTARSLDDFEVYTSVNDPQWDGLSIYPNPFSQYIRLSGLENVRSIRLVNSLGQVMREVLEPGHDIEWSTSGLRNGLYFIQLTGEDGAVRMEKIIKQ